MRVTGENEELRKNLSQRHTAHHKSHMDWPGYYLGLHSERPVTNRLSHGMASNAALICFVPYYFI
jgi:hypothetical protein